jgi:hypothetical protein
MVFYDAQASKWKAAKMAISMWLPVDVVASRLSKRGKVVKVFAEWISQPTF